MVTFKSIIFTGPLILLIMAISIFLKNITPSMATSLDLKELRKVVIDTDAGADDALAIFLALKYEATHNQSFKVIAITCTYGNTKKQNVETNVLKVLSTANRSDIPVYSGAESPLIKNWEDNHYFGTDGLGDFNFTEQITARVDQSKHAVVALIDLVKLYPGEVSIISLGPLTNLALAIRLDATFIEKVDEFVIVGSSISGIGNISPNVEFNFGTDPESSFIVFNSTTKPSTLVPWETVIEYTITKEWRQNTFGRLNSSTVSFLNKAEAISIEKINTWSDIDGRAIAVILWPNLVTKFLETNITPIFDGAAQGSILVDYLNITGKSHNAKIVQSFDVELYKEKLLKYFTD